MFMIIRIRSTLSSSWGYSFSNASASHTLPHPHILLRSDHSRVSSTYWRNRLRFEICRVSWAKNHSFFICSRSRNSRNGSCVPTRRRSRELQHLRRSSTNIDADGRCALTWNSVLYCSVLVDDAWCCRVEIVVRMQQSMDLVGTNCRNNPHHRSRARRTTMSRMMMRHSLEGFDDRVRVGGWRTMIRMSSKDAQERWRRMKMMHMCVCVMDRLTGSVGVSLFCSAHVCAFLYTISIVLCSLGEGRQKKHSRNKRAFGAIRLCPLQ